VYLYSREGGNLALGGNAATDMFGRGFGNSGKGGVVI